MHKPTERPVLFSGEMVRAILAGRKTQTRRVITPVPDWGHPLPVDSVTPEGWQGPPDFSVWGHQRDEDRRRCPYGAPGDRLYVREAFRLAEHHDEDPPSEFCAAHEVAMWYEADGFVANPKANDTIRPGRLRPSIHMPRWASRITLEVTGVRVERVQEITEADAEAEGVESSIIVSGYGPQYAGDFADLWDEINGGRGYGWDTNPWVWVVEFRRVDEATETATEAGASNE